ncbi:hypothetical protein [Methylobacterium marchantiae]|uniref:N-acetyltransferase domain-containing protein n=1 Tax=Methylobacterium marchantiae TaxID=600331 RepID=A0ABW3X3G8_9HYPH
MVATNHGQRNAFRAQRLFAEVIDTLHLSYPVLEAWAYEGNTLHHHWMERLGFVRTGDRRLMGMGAPFLLFTRTKETPPCA